MTETTNCQSRSRTAHSNPEMDPEMFTVHGRGAKAKATVQCLAHARLAEARGCRVELILT